MKVTCLILFLLVSSIPCKAIYITSGNDLVTQCKASLDLTAALEHDTALPSPQEQRDALHCMGLVEGVSETLDDWTFIDQQSTETHVKHACIPGDVTLEQEINTFLKYADSHPELLHQTGSSLVINALTEAFHCKT